MARAEKTPLSSLDEQIAIRLAAGKTITAVAESLKIGRRTVYRHMTPAVKARIVELRAESVERAVGMLAEAMPEAVAKVIADMNDKDKRRSMTAVKLLVSMYCKLQGVRAVDELDELLAKVAEKRK